MAFKKATKHEAKARIAILGPSGAGKSYTALAVASGLGTRIAAIDTEHGTLSKYSDLFAFDVQELSNFAPMQYMNAISEAEAAGYEVLVIDSLSHAWNGQGGLLSQADIVTKRGGNSYTAWADLTPQHIALIEAQHACKMHLVVTMRSKQEYVLEQNSKGKQVPRKVGMGAVQRDGMEYEYDCVLEMDYAHVARITKTRAVQFDGVEIEKPGAAFGREFRAWLAGAPAVEPKALPQQERKSTPPPAANGGAIFGRAFPNKNYATKPLKDAPLEILEDYRVWLESVLKDDRKRSVHDTVRKSIAAATAEVERQIATSEAQKQAPATDPIIEGLEKEVEKRDAPDQDPNNGDETNEMAEGWK